VVAKRLDSRYRPRLRSKSWTKTKHYQTRTFRLLGWGCRPEEWRRDRVASYSVQKGNRLAGVVESGYGRDLVEQLPAPTRSELDSLQEPGRVWDGNEPMIGDMKYLEWSLGGGLRQATTLVGSRRAGV
jgi:ATP-dependent DNA ligase